MLLPQGNGNLPQGNSNLFPQDLSEKFNITMIAFILLLGIAVCLSKVDPDFFTSVYRDLKHVHCFITYKGYWHQQ